MRRLLRWAAGLGTVLLVVAIGGLVAWRIWRGPDPADILSRIPDEPVPVLSPEAEQASFRLAPGFRVELVASEPLVVDPVAMDWDDEGRLYVVEMRGFMPDVDGTGEDAAIGRVVVLTDTDGDGRMDSSHVFLDGLVLPRAIAVLPEGVLVGVPPDLWLCRVTGGEEPVCGQRTRLSHYALGRHDPEHLENGLLPGIDGWIHNAKSGRRFRLRGDTLEVDDSAFRGQWGLAQDDEGLLFHNHNSAFLYGDLIPGHYPMRQPGTASEPNKPGIGVALSEGEEVFGVRPEPGLNRAYLHGSLRPDGRQLAPTGVSGLAIQRGDQYGPEYVGDAFVPEVAGNLVAHFEVARDGLGLQSRRRTYPDPDFETRDFLASTDERFRPVDAEVGPDGSVWVIDMYRGLVQHANYVSPHLRAYAAAHDLAIPGETGRIWRIVRDDRDVPRRPPPLASLDQQVAALDHPNGWVRDRAQRRLIHDRDPRAIAALRDLDGFGPAGRPHAVWALSGLGGLDATTLAHALGDADPVLRRSALRASEKQLMAGDGEVRGLVLERLGDPDPAVRLQAAHSLGELPSEQRPLDALLAIGRSGDPLDAQAAVSSLSGREREALEGELERLADADADAGSSDWLRALVVADFLAARQAQDLAAIGSLLDRAVGPLPSWQAVALLEGIRDAQSRPGTERIELAAAHPLFGEEQAPGLAAAIAGVRQYFTWPGDPTPGGARPLTPEEERLRARGGALYVATCAACHGEDGRGQTGLAPSLVSSAWVRDSDDWIVRIILDGLTGPVLVGDREWNANMPPHGTDSRFDDRAIAGLVTYLRRAWGHAEEPVRPEAVAAVRAARGGRMEPWTIRELLTLDVDHRLDPYTGIYEVPIIGMELEVARQQTVLALGMKGGGKAVLSDLGGGRFMGEGILVDFTSDEDGSVRRATVHRDGRAIAISKQD